MGTNRNELRDTYPEDHARLLSHRPVFEGAVSTMWVDDLELASTGARMTREWLERPHAVAILPVREGEGGAEVLLIRQYRQPVHGVLWEVPAGLLDIEGEEPEHAARRELMEESGLAAEKLEFLASFYGSSGSSSERLTCYAATGLSEGESDFVREDEEAEIVTRWFPFDDVLSAVLDGRLESSSLVVSVLAYAARSGAR